VVGRERGQAAVDGEADGRAGAEVVVINDDKQRSEEQEEIPGRRKGRRDDVPAGN